MREKLIELLGSTEYGNGSLVGNNFQEGFIAKIADHLLANGVIVLPCKVGDTVWSVSTKHISKVKHIEKTKVSRIAVDADAVWLVCECNPIARCTFGKTVFLTREEAEAALRKEDEGK